MFGSYHMLVKGHLSPLLHWFSVLKIYRLQTSKLTYVFVALRADMSFVSLSAHKGVVMLFD